MKKRTPLFVPILWFVVTGIWTATLCLDFCYNSVPELIGLRCLCVASSLAAAIVHLVRYINGKQDEATDIFE